MTQTMQAAVLEVDGRFGVREVPIPVPGAAEVLVRVEACGVCHTDLHYTHHGVKTAKTPPVILGHEAAGTVVGVGPEGSPLDDGAHVLIPAVLWCDACEACRSGHGNLCANMEMLGNHRDGGFAEYVAVPARCLVPLPDGLPTELACLVADAVSTAYHAVVDRARVRPGERVLVVGCGGVGLNVVQVAALAGAIVYACDRVPEKLEIARSLGATEVLDAAGDSTRLGATLRKQTGGMDCAFEVVGRRETLRLALDSLRPGGRLGVVGYSQEDLPLAPSRVMFRELTIFGSLGCPPASLTRALDLAARGRIRLSPLLSGRYALDDIAKAFEEVHAGRALRGVIFPSWGRASRPAPSSDTPGGVSVPQRGEAT